MAVVVVIGGSMLGFVIALISFLVLGVGIVAALLIWAMSGPLAATLLLPPMRLFAARSAGDMSSHRDGTEPA